MTHEVVPDATDLLCENCGYLLNGLPPDGNCPECGLSVAASTSASPRKLPDWEAGTDHAAVRFQATAFAVLRRPNEFFRTLSIRGDENRSRKMALLLLVPLVIFCSKTVILHYYITFKLSGLPAGLNPGMALPLVPILVAVSLVGLYFAVVHLTVIEAKFWGLRLQLNVVRRAMHYLTVHVVAASLLPLAVVTTYLFMLLGSDNAGLYMADYLYVLCAAIVISALYVFTRYWRAMKALINANA